VDARGRRLDHRGVSEREPLAPRSGDARSAHFAATVGARTKPHPVTLRFADEALERAFADAYAASSRRAYRRIVPIMALAFLAFSPIDVIIDGGSYTVLTIRLMVAPVLAAAVAFGFASPATFARGWQAMLAVMFGASAVAVAAMNFFVHTPERLKDLCLGVCLITLAGHTIIMLRFSWASLVSVLAVASYTTASALAPNVPAIDAIENLAWLLCATAMGMIGSYALERHRRREFAEERLLDAERTLTERLLLNVLPEPIARRLRRGESSIAESFPEVTVLFADLVGFTSLADRLSPEAIVRVLDDLFSAFDDEAQRLGLEKIKTIGDAYMVVGGLPTPRDDHADAVAEMALAMLAITERYRVPSGERLEMRVGVHSGAVIAGVIGKNKFIYDLWGDTVNTASRMESHGVVGEAQITEAARARLGPRFATEPRGEVDIKGKGVMQTHLLRRA
jgi:class 3 adenylate cyclase